MKLLSELQSIYPIEPLDNGEHAIRGLELPVDLKYVYLNVDAICNGLFPVPRMKSWWLHLCAMWYIC